MEKLIKEKNYNCEVGQSQIIRIVTYYKSQEYVLKIYPSKDGITLVFKLERDKQILTNYYFEKFDLKDFHHTNKIFLLDDNIKEVFNHLHEISTNSQLFLEKEKFKIRILFRDVKEENSIIKFILRKKLILQEKLNLSLVTQMKENKDKLSALNKEMIKLDSSLQKKNGDIGEINISMNELNSIINNMNLNNKNNINKNEKSKDDSIKEDKTNEIKNDEEELIKESTKELLYFYEQQELEQRKNIKKKKKPKAKSKNKKQKTQSNEEKKKNEESCCFENIDIFQNKKLIELLVILNIVTIIIVLYLLNSIYTLKSNIENDNLKDEDIMNKITYLSYLDDSNGEFTNDYKDIFRDNININLKNKEVEKITSVKEEYQHIMDERSRKNKDKRKKSNNFYD